MKKIVFLHIQKTAGNSLHQILYNNRIGYVALKYSTAEALDKDRLSKMQRRHPVKITGIGGHQLDCTDKNAFFGEDQYTFTVLRNPVDRYLSFYNHMRKKADYNFTFDEFLAGESQYNYQTKCIAKEPNARKAIAILENNFDCVGVFEQMEKTLNILSHDLDLDINQKKLNVTSGKALTRADLTPEQLMKAQQNNAIDVEVFEWALAVLDAQENKEPSAKRVSTLTKKGRSIWKKGVSWWCN